MVWLTNEKHLALFPNRTNGHHCQRSSPSRTSDMLWAGFEPVQNLSSGFDEWSYKVMITTTPQCHCWVWPWGQLGRSVLQEKSPFKMLGLTFSSKLDWGSYNISIAKTVSRKIGAFVVWSFSLLKLLCISINLA